jgi:hypothetical protein
MLELTKNTLAKDIHYAILKLLEMARERCWNDISDNCEFIISEIKNSNNANSFIERIERNERNNKKYSKSFDWMIKELEEMYANLYDINLQIYNASKNKTIIEVSYYPKSALILDYLEKVKANEPTLHCQLLTPPYVNSDKKKAYDINWHLGGFVHHWRIYWWNKKISL